MPPGPTWSSELNSVPEIGKRGKHLPHMDHVQKDTLNISSLGESASFDANTFLVVPPRTFDELKIGDVFRAPSRTLTDAHSAAFQTVSADNHPIHYDVEWARKHGHSAPVVHGLLKIGRAWHPNNHFPTQDHRRNRKIWTPKASVVTNIVAKCLKRIYFLQA